MPDVVGVGLRTENEAETSAARTGCPASQNTPVFQDGRHRQMVPRRRMATKPVQQVVNADRSKSCPPEALSRGHVTHSQFGFAWHTP